MPTLAETTAQMFAFVTILAMRVIVRISMSILQRDVSSIHRLELISLVIIFHRLDVLWIRRG